MALIWFLALIFLLSPFLFVLMFVLISSYLYLYKLIYGRQGSNLQDIWQAPLNRVAQFLYYHSKFYHGYEIHGLENIPDGPAILIFYHSAMPIDIYYAGASIYFKKNRKIIPIVQREMIKHGGLQTLAEAIEGTAGTIDSCVEILKKGKLLAISPGGGLREDFLSDSSYKLDWGTRRGFAKVAIEAKVPLFKPIIPMFTQNSREMNFAPNLFMDLVKKIYEKNKVTFRLLLGWFPVKLRTYIGRPIEYEPNRSVDELVKITKESLEKLIKQH